MKSITRPVKSLISTSAAGLTLLGVFTSECAQAADLPLPAQPLLQQQERDRALREQLEPTHDVRLQLPAEPLGGNRLIKDQAPCFPIRKIVLGGEAAAQFQWALAKADPKDDPATGQCLGAQGINLTMKRIQNAIIERGYVTTRVLAQPQDLRSGVLQLTVIPGRIHAIRFAAGTSSRANAWNALPASPGDLLNLRDIEQALENFKRVPTADADIQIAATQGANAKPGESDLVIAWKQKLPVRFSLSMDDSGTDATGKYLGTASVSLDNILSLNDLFYASYNHDLGGGDSGDRGSRGHTLHYSVPYGYWLLGVTSSEYDYHQSVSGANQSYLYTGTSKTNEISLSRLLYRDAVRKTTATLSGWTRSSQNYIDDTQIEIQRRRMAGWAFGLSHREFIGTATLDVGANYKRGTGARNALSAPEETLNQGTSRAEIITSDAQLSIPFGLGSQRLRYTSTWRAQWNRTPLVPQDRFSIGGRYSVRGFDGENILSADRGWLNRNDLALALGNSGQETYLGVDYGEVGGQSSRYLSGTHLAGAVVGLRGGYQSISYDVFVGQPLSKPKGFDTASTTAGFSLTWSM
ncbi:ShlB/FhaC/HecB family hemolysin secretion/activation protein [Pseudomonas abieticivorans]|uniref:ShlB/FhaC/HecB family hemolysin secretion/activation protein n=1 Tax=Pseudomonas abieticivorans TaxID=2931382 RepID=UPI0020BF5E3F|nr:ShlB/FhaC/HecB family hemolysin secretion/activation protein [Pseudomonas sp. PIA16]